MVVCFSVIPKRMDCINSSEDGSGGRGSMRALLEHTPPLTPAFTSPLAPPLTPAFTPSVTVDAAAIDGESPTMGKAAGCAALHGGVCMEEGWGCVVWNDCDDRVADTADTGAGVGKASVEVAAPTVALFVRSFVVTAVGFVTVVFSSSSLPPPGSRPLDAPREYSNTRCATNFFEGERGGMYLACLAPRFGGSCQRGLNLALGDLRVGGGST